MTDEVTTKTRGLRWRYAFGAIAVLVAVTFGLHASLWVRQGAVNWPMALLMSGLFIQMVVGAVEPASKSTRLVWNVIGAVPVFSGAAAMWLR